MADFFWGWDKEKRKYHWASWDTMCLPLDEGVVDFQKQADIMGSILESKILSKGSSGSKKLHTGQSLEHMLDEAVWKTSEKGQFSCATAWEHIRHRKEKNNCSKNIWHKLIPFKISFLVWRALRGKLPTNERIIKFGREAAQCSCCYSPGEDTIDHIFVTGHFANNIWRFFSAVAGLPHEHSTIHTLLQKWRNLAQATEVQKLATRLLPVIILWNLWKNRCAAKYGAKQSNTA
ncbi:uncharacterized protein LOC107021433 [Solanum pennellii]|uniref:Uncharacterized protein LOC107021433 n=1 Tax=Solanum pennellii TaxID=28526 RepID=A0ABM1GY36_SOLPN|nr:uncharacterized protein LOC107021433 [Solanum pennellii]